MSVSACITKGETTQSPGAVTLSYDMLTGSTHASMLLTVCNSTVQAVVSSNSTTIFNGSEHMFCSKPSRDRHAKESRWRTRMDEAMQSKACRGDHVSMTGHFTSWICFCRLMQRVLKCHHLSIRAELSWPCCQPHIISTVDQPKGEAST